ncbi:glycoside hydrolase family 43 protein [Pedobacter frigiditerrae]|uniref:glycoside hydrolase family 43 protein n=1 Tax=Pedobacter frigiditerrae TaxID=2530452 RepID=UPI002931C73D|nr:glycoside hydrolase family 43 protein [Pedobacter frigiditerrae]
MSKTKFISSFHIAIIGLVCCALTSCSKYAYVFTSFHEPANEGLRLLYAKDGLHWTDLNKIFLKPAVGTQKIMRDPSIVQGPDGTFHLVWTCSWKGDNGFGYASSKDLKNWSEQKFIPVMQKEPTTVNVWAPEIFYDDENSQFIIIWASTIPFRFPKGIEDEDNNHRMYSITTKDFKTFSEPKLFLDLGFSVIDAVIVKRAVKDYVLVLKDNTRPNRNLKIAFSDHALGPYTNISESFSPKLTEGPTVLRQGNKYLIYYDAYGDKKYTTLKTYDFKNFEDISSSTTIPEGHKHGTVMRVEKKILRNLKK